MSNRQYVGKGKSFGNFGQIKLNINTKDFSGNTILEPNENGWFKTLILSKMQNPDSRGNEYTIYIDDFKPDPNRSKQVIEQQDDSNLPF